MLVGYVCGCVVDWVLLVVAVVVEPPVDELLVDELLVDAERIGVVVVVTKCLL